MLLLVAKVLWGAQEAQRARGMAGTFIRRHPARYLCYWGIAGSRS